MLDHRPGLGARAPRTGFPLRRPAGACWPSRPGPPPRSATEPVTAGTSERTSANGRAKVSGSAVARPVRASSSSDSRSRRRAETRARRAAEAAWPRTALAGPAARPMRWMSRAEPPPAGRAATRVRENALAPLPPRPLPREEKGAQDVGRRLGRRGEPVLHPRLDAGAASVRGTPPIRARTRRADRAGRPAAGGRRRAPSPRRGQLVERQLDSSGSSRWNTTTSWPRARSCRRRSARSAGASSRSEKSTIRLRRSASSPT